jgi:hypothetical protein
MDSTGWLIDVAPGFIPYFILVLIWSLVWKGVALWKAARNSDKAWFIALLILNTIGILEIFYIFVFSKRADNKTNRNESVKKEADEAKKN